MAKLKNSTKMATGSALTSRATILFAGHSVSKEIILALGLVKHCQNFIICSRTFLSAGSPGQLQSASSVSWQPLTKNEADKETQ